MNSFFSLLRYSLGITDKFDILLSAQDWENLYQTAYSQAVVGLLFNGVKKLAGEYAPPMMIAMRWAAQAEKIRGMNKAFNTRAKELTELFLKLGFKTLILKGQANSRLYPDDGIRQPGDIDIFIEGGKEKVLKMLSDNHLINKEDFVAYHHVELADESGGIVVEAHFRPSGGVHNYFGNKHLQIFLNANTDNAYLTEEGFNVPSMQFAMAMQLAHVQHHFIESGVGLRQVTDYYYLLKTSSKNERDCVAAMLKSFRLEKFAAALMWVLQYVFQLDEEHMLCKPDPKKGDVLFNAITEAGNFGYLNGFSKDNFVKRFIKRRIRLAKQFVTFPRDIIWEVISYTKYVIYTLPWRIRYRRLTVDGKRIEKK